jgi:hypothetical protein
MSVMMNACVLMSACYDVDGPVWILLVEESAVVLRAEAHWVPGAIGQLMEFSSVSFPYCILPWLDAVPSLIGMETIPQFNFHQILQVDSIFDYWIIHQCITGMACFLDLQVEKMGTCGNSPILCPDLSQANCRTFLRGNAEYPRRVEVAMPANASILRKTWLTMTNSAPMIKSA